MKRFPTLLLTFFLLFLSMNALSEPANLGLHKIELEHYFDSGLYLSDIQKKIREAKYYLNFRIIQNKRLHQPRKLAIVFAVDETTLSNYQDLRRFQFGGTPEEIVSAISDGHDNAIDPALGLYRFAIKHGVAVFFVSSRKEYEKRGTIKNLQDAGYEHWDGLFMESNSYNDASSIPFKIQSRKKIIEMGYDIVLNIGAQYCDLKGGYADMTVKLPNPFYYLS